MRCRRSETNSSCSRRRSTESWSRGCIVKRDKWLKRDGGDASDEQKNLTAQEPLCVSLCRGAGAVGLVASRLWKQRPAPSPAAPPGLLPLLIPPPARPVHPAAAAPAASHGAHAAALPRTGRAGGSDAERLHSSCVLIPVPLRCSGKPT